MAIENTVSSDLSSAFVNCQERFRLPPIRRDISTSIKRAYRIRKSKGTHTIHSFKHIYVCGTQANNADPDHALPNAASNQDLQCLPTVLLQNYNKNEKYHPTILGENGLAQLTRHGDGAIYSALMESSFLLK